MATCCRCPEVVAAGRRPPPRHLDANASRPVTPAAWAAYRRGEALLARQRWPAGPRRLMAAARRKLAGTLAVAADDIVLCGGGTEANAWGLDVAMAAVRAGWRSPAPPEVLVSQIEHPAVAQTAARLAGDYGLRLRWVAPGRQGEVAAAAFAAMLTPATALCCLMVAHNETGVLQPLAAAVAACRTAARALGGAAPRWHADAVQAAPCLPLRPAELGIDSLAFAGHKLGAVGGIGCLWLRGGRRPAAWHDGGVDDELSAAAAWSMAAALAEVAGAGAGRRALAASRDALEAELAATGLGLEVVGGGGQRLPHTSCLRLPGVPADGLMMALDLAGFCASTGSACASGALAPSPSLLAMGMSAAAAREVLRISLGAVLPAAARRRLVAEVAACAARARAG